VDSRAGKTDGQILCGGKTLKLYGTGGVASWLF